MLKLRNKSGLREKANRKVKSCGVELDLYTYRVATEKSKVPLKVGFYVTTINFRLNYD